MGSFKQAALVTQLKKKGSVFYVKKRKRWIKEKKTNHFSWTEVRPSPSGGIGGAAVEAPSANPISELCGSIIRVDNRNRGLVDWGILTTIIVTHLWRWRLWMSHSWYIEVRLSVVL